MARPRLGEEGESGVATVTRTEKKLKKPPLYKVLLHNDDYTTREFVIHVLMGVFHHDESAATRIMWLVHTTGVGVAGVYTHEIAETKSRKVESMARARDFPLRCTIEADE